MLLLLLKKIERLGGGALMDIDVNLRETMIYALGATRGGGGADALANSRKPHAHALCGSSLSDSLLYNITCSPRARQR